MGGHPPTTLSSRPSNSSTSPGASGLPGHVPLRRSDLRPTQAERMALTHPYRGSRTTSVEELPPARVGVSFQLTFLSTRRHRQFVSALGDRRRRTPRGRLTPEGGHTGTHDMTVVPSTTIQRNPQRPAEATRQPPSPSTKPPTAPRVNEGNNNPDPSADWVASRFGADASKPRDPGGRPNLYTQGRGSGTPSDPLALPTFHSIPPRPSSSSASRKLMPGEYGPPALMRTAAGGTRGTTNRRRATSGGPPPKYVPFSETHRRLAMWPTQKEWYPGPPHPHIPIPRCPQPARTARGPWRGSSASHPAGLPD